MHSHLLTSTKSPALAFHGVLHRIGNLPDSLLDFIHTDEGVHILEYVLKRTVFRYITLNVILLDQFRVNAATDERGEDIFSLSDGLMGKAEGLVLGLNPVFEVSLQLLVSLWSIV